MTTDEPAGPEAIQPAGREAVRPARPGASEPAAGQTPERIGTFTDAIFAIAMTLLVIEIPRPDSRDIVPGGVVTTGAAVSNLWNFLVAERDAFYGYLLAFFILWIIWRQHHVMLDQVVRVTGPMVAWHFPLLLFVAFLPYVSALVGHAASNPLAAVLFGVVFTGIMASRSAIHDLAGRAALKPGVDQAQMDAVTRVSWLVTVYWVATLALAWWTTWVQLAWFATPLVAEVLTRFPRRAAHS